MRLDADGFPLDDDDEVDDGPGAARALPTGAVAVSVLGGTTVYRYHCASCGTSFSLRDQAPPPCPGCHKPLTPGMAPEKEKRVRNLYRYYCSSCPRDVESAKRARDELTCECGGALVAGARPLPPPTCGACPAKLEEPCGGEPGGARCDVEVVQALDTTITTHDDGAPALSPVEAALLAFRTAIATHAGASLRVGRLEKELADARRELESAEAEIVRMHRG